MRSINLVFDIEGNDLYEKVTHVWCIVAKDVETGEVFRFRPHEINKALDLLRYASCLIGHNIIDYDLPTLEKLYGFTYTGRIVDTLVFSRLLNPDRYGGHSLKSWGIRLGCLKGDFGEDEEDEEDKIDAFKEYTEDMLDYCEQDVEVTYKLYEKLIKEQQELENEG